MSRLTKSRVEPRRRASRLVVPPNHPVRRKRTRNYSVNEILIMPVLLTMERPGECAFSSIISVNRAGRLRPTASVKQKAPETSRSFA